MYDGFFKWMGEATFYILINTLPHKKVSCTCSCIHIVHVHRDLVLTQSHTQEKSWSMDSRILFFGNVHWFIFWKWRIYISFVGIVHFIENSLFSWFHCSICKWILDLEYIDQIFCLVCPKMICVLMPTYGRTGSRCRCWTANQGLPHWTAATSAVTPPSPLCFFEEELAA